MVKLKKKRIQRLKGGKNREKMACFCNFFKAIIERQIDEINKNNYNNYYRNNLT